jgi:hypothetical protein
MRLKKQSKRQLLAAIGTACLVVSCMKTPRNSQPLVIKEDPRPLPEPKKFAKKHLLSSPMGYK